MRFESLVNLVGCKTRGLITRKGERFESLVNLVRYKINFMIERTIICNQRKKDTLIRIISVIMEKLISPVLVIFNGFIVWNVLIVDMGIMPMVMIFG